MEIACNVIHNSTSVLSNPLFPVMPPVFGQTSEVKRDNSITLV
jgi:hypothetical protein